MSFHEAIAAPGRKSRAPAASVPAAAVGLMVQRKCACGTHDNGAGCEECKKKWGRQKSSDHGRASTPGLAPPIVHEVLRSPGDPLDPAVRALMEPRFRQDFSGVRVHTDSKAAQSARAVQALAFTAGRHIVFDSARNTPDTSSNQPLLAHELTHVIQQDRRDPGEQVYVGSPHNAFEREADQQAQRLERNSGTQAAESLGLRRAPPDLLQRAALGGGLIGAGVGAGLGALVGGLAGGGIGALIGGAAGLVAGGLIGALIGSRKEKRIALTCPIECEGTNLGTISSTGLFFHASRQRTVEQGSAEATGVGTSLHFNSSGAEVEDGCPCDCDEFKIIQVLETTHPAAGQGDSYVDNAGRDTPFYGDVYLSGEGRHVIPAGYPGAGETTTSTHSIYDRPYRTTESLEARDLRWEAEACVACVKTAEPDLILGGITYGFSRTYNAAEGSFGAVQGMGPACRETPSTHFLDTLRNDPSVSAYDFEGR
jgi:hypothetical protein